MQAIGKLHQDNPDIPGHGQGHFLKVLGLGIRKEQTAITHDDLQILDLLVINLRRDQRQILSQLLRGPACGTDKAEVDRRDAGAFTQIQSIG